MDKGAWSHRRFGGKGWSYRLDVGVFGKINNGSLVVSNVVSAAV